MFTLPSFTGLSQALGAESTDSGRSCACDVSFHDPAGAAVDHATELHVDAAACPGEMWNES